MSKKFFFLLSFLMFPIMVFAKDEFILTCDKGNYYVDDQFICRVSINQEVAYDEIDFSYEFDDGIELVDVRSNYEKVWQISNENQVISAKTKSDSLESGLQEYGILLFKAKNDGIHSIKLTNIKSKNSSENAEKLFDDVTNDVKIISTNNNIKEIKINGKVLDGFTNSEKLYNIQASDEKINIEVVLENEFAKITGDGNYTFGKDTNELIVPISVLSENGNQKIVILRFYKNDNIQNASLKGILIKDNKNNNLILDFKPDTYEYYLNVNSSVTELEISPDIEFGEFVKNYGKQTIKLINGDNVVEIRLKDENSNTRTYFIFITKTIKNASSNNFISDLKIDGYSLEFSKRVKNYTLEVKKSVNKLNITPTLEDASASYIIKGNDSLTEGSVIKIIVTAENGARATYQITIKYITVNYALYLFLILAVICGGYVLVKYRKIISSSVKKLAKKNKINNVAKQKINKKNVNPIRGKDSSSKSNTNKSVKTSNHKKATTKKKKTTKKKSTKNKKKKSSKKSKKK